MVCQGRGRRWGRVVLLGRPHGLRRRILRRVFGSDTSPAQSEPTPTVPPAPANAVDLCGLEELAEGTIGEFFVDDEAFAVAHVDGQVYALSNTCPHADGPLGDGTMDGCIVACPWHGWTFDVRTGVCELDAEVVVPTHPVFIENGRIYLER